MFALQCKILANACEHPAPANRQQILFSAKRLGTYREVEGNDSSLYEAQNFLQVLCFSLLPLEVTKANHTIGFSLAQNTR